MSVILDALRRAKSSAPPRRPGAAPPFAGIPAGLRVSPASGAARRGASTQGETRWGLVIGVVTVAVAVYGGVRFGLPLMLPTESNLALARPDNGAVAPAEGPGTMAPAAAPSGIAAPGTSAPSNAAAASAVVSLVQTQADMPGSLTETPERIQEPPAITPRAVPNARPASTVPAAAAPPPATAPRTLAPPTPARPPLNAAANTDIAAPAAAAVPAAPVVNHMDLAQRYHRLGDFEQALTHYNAVLAADAFNVTARNNLGLLYGERGLTGEAVEQFRRAITIDPNYMWGRLNLAAVLLGADRLAEARAELRAALALEPRNADALVNMALVEKADRRPDEAKSILLSALAADAGHVAAHYNLAVLHDEAGDGQRAIEHYNEFLRRAGPEHGARLTDVRRRLDTLSPRTSVPASR